MGHQVYVLLFTENTVSNPSVVIPNQAARFRDPLFLGPIFLGQIGSKNQQPGFEDFFSS